MKKKILSILTSVAVFMSCLNLCSSALVESSSVETQGSYRLGTFIDVSSDTFSEENDITIPFDDVTITVDIPKTGISLTQSSGEYEEHIFKLHGGFKECKNGKFYWYYNLDCETAIINKPHVILKVSLRANFTDGCGNYSQEVGRGEHIYTWDFDYPQDYTFESPARTGYYTYAYSITSVGEEDDFIFIVNSVLLNRTGHEWTFTYSAVGKTLPMPRADYVKGQIYPRNDHLYITYYERYYQHTGIELDRSLYQVHHIQPLSYGGSNSYDNLIHLPIDLHKSITAWFNGY